MFLEAEKHTSKIISTAAEADAIDYSHFDCVLLDLKLPDGNGMALIPKIAAEAIAPEIIVVTSNGSITSAVEAVREGAHDFLVKPFSAGRLITTLNKTMETHSLRKKVSDIEATFDKGGLEGFIGSSLPMQAVYRIIEQAAPSEASVFITGESGTGKELAAEALHNLSSRSEGPFVALNCAAIPKDLIESELFGHKRGAFTGATCDRLGAAARADKGTLFLDELCELDIDLQSKLLRFIQSREYQRVGGDRSVASDIRIVAASNCDPYEAVSSGILREDLFFRLHVIPLLMPPLRDRGQDIVKIAETCLASYNESEGKGFTSFSQNARDALICHSWKGNVRELQNKIRQAVVLYDGEVIRTHMLDLHSVYTKTLQMTEDSTPGQASANAPRELGETQPELWQIERDAIENVITRCDGNIQKASRQLCISPSTIYRKRKTWAKNEEQANQTCESVA